MLFACFKAILRESESRCVRVQASRLDPTSCCWSSRGSFTASCSSGGVGACIEGLGSRFGILFNKERPNKGLWFGCFDCSVARSNVTQTLKIKTFPGLQAGGEGVIGVCGLFVNLN